MENRQVDCDTIAKISDGRILETLNSGLAGTEPAKNFRTFRVLEQQLVEVGSPLIHHL